ncbi:DUF6777 domain-containing protein [Streptomyces sp. NPDC015131]|uniref:DUF6777 domain-containing protein n=1 Tax=Streptomyces sp. NPDC015131 TaxID=3364941 RepID=UPI0036FCC813
MRSPTARRRPGAAALAAPVALLLAAWLLTGCGGEDDAGRGEAGARAVTDLGEARLEPAGARGAHPFTESTVRRAQGTRAAPPPAVLPGSEGPYAVVGSAPGLYGGTRSVPSCDVERQIRLLTENDTLARAFARAAGIGPAAIAPWLRGLTTAELRADTRVTSHDYRDGGAEPHQAVLQAGTAVLVDPYGAPRVRCRSGSPLRTPVLDRPSGGDRGAGGAAPAAGGAGAAVAAKPWAGHHPGRVVIVTPTEQVVTGLLIVDLRDNTWIERLMGGGGARDRRPASPPRYAPGDRPLAVAAVPRAPSAAGTVDPADCPTSLDGGGTVPPGCPTPPPSPPPPADPATDAPVVPDAPEPRTPEGPAEPAEPAQPAEPAVPDGPGAADGSGLPDAAGEAEGAPSGAVPEVVPETVPEPEPAPDAVPEGAPETVPDALPEIVAEAGPESAFSDG